MKGDTSTPLVSVPAFLGRNATLIEGLNRLRHKAVRVSWMSSSSTVWMTHLYLIGLEYELSTPGLEDLATLGAQTMLLELRQSEGAKHYINQIVRVELGVDDTVLSHDGILEIHTDRDGGLLTLSAATLTGDLVMRPAWR